MIGKLTLHQEVSVDGNKYTVIGVDKYSLKNISGKIKEWESYTLKDTQGNKTWLSYGAVEDYFIQWALISEEDFNKQAEQSVNLDLSGIAHITFQGNPGFSTPEAEIIWFNLKNEEFDYVAFERFLEQKDNEITPLESYYNTGKILKDFKP